MNNNDETDLDMNVKLCFSGLHFRPNYDLRHLFLFPCNASCWPEFVRECIFSHVRCCCPLQLRLPPSNG